MDCLDEYELLAMLYCACQYSNRYNNQALELNEKEVLDVDRKQVDGLVQRIFEDIDVEDIDVEEIKSDKILPWIKRVKKAVTADLEEVEE